MTRYTRLTTCLLTAGALAGAVRAAGSPEETAINEVAAYTIDSDTYELLRYSFATDDFTAVGVVETASGDVIKDCESLGYIPSGPHKGVYSAPTNGAYSRHLVKIDPLTAVATSYNATLVSASRKITGMVPYYDAGAGEWLLLAASSEDRASDPDSSESRILVRIDPADGTSTIVATKAMLDDGRRFEGLAIDARGYLYATSRTHFFRIHHEAGFWVEELGETGLDKAEAFEIAFGDYQNSITIPGVDPSWTQHGVFFVACERTQQFGVLNPTDGSFQEYLVGGSPSNFITKDAEGLILLTLRHDPLYGSLVGFD